MYPERNQGPYFASEGSITSRGERGEDWRVYSRGTRLRETQLMLDAFIIEEIKRRERTRDERDRPAVELPLPVPEERPRRRTETEDDEKPQRGVIIIDLCG
jgi:hypothetical protein